MQLAFAQVSNSQFADLFATLGSEQEEEIGREEEEEEEEEEDVKAGKERATRSAKKGPSSLSSNIACKRRRMFRLR